MTEVRDRMAAPLTAAWVAGWAITLSPESARKVVRRFEASDEMINLLKKLAAHHEAMRRRERILFLLGGLFGGLCCGAALGALLS